MPLSRSQGCDGWKAVVPAILRVYGGGEWLQMIGA